MHDDEFLSQFRKAPRPEFAEALRAKLASQDVSEKGKIMSMPVTSTSQSRNGSDPVEPASPKPQRRGYFVMLAASIVLIVFFGTIIAANLQPRSAPIPAAPAPLMSATPAPLPTTVPSTTTPKQQVSFIDAVTYKALWSPNGEFLVLATSEGAWVYNANDLTAPLYNIYPGIAVISTVIFSPDSRILAFATEQGVRLWDLTKQQKIEATMPHGGFNTMLALNADGSILAVADYQGMIYFHHVNTNTTISSAHVFQGFQPIYDMRFNPSGTRLTFMGAQTPFLTLEDTTGTWRSVDEQPAEFSPTVLSEGIIQSMGYSPDGSKLSTRVNGLIVIWDAATGTELKRLDTSASLDQMLPMKSGTGDMTFNADGSQIVTVDTSIRIWDVASGKARTVVGSSIGEFHVAMSTVYIKPDWSQVALSASGTVVIIDMATGKEIARIGQATTTFEYGGHVTNVNSEPAIAAMQDAGMSWIKITKHFNGTVTGDASEEIAAAHANGFKVLITADGSARSMTQRSEDYTNSYVRWLGEIAAAGADAIEVWTEPNLDRNWPMGQIGGGRYADLLKAGYQSIKTANNGTLVISAAPAPTGAEAAFPGMVQNDYNWLQELVQAGGLEYLDCVGIHYNEGVLPPDATSGDPRDSYHTRYFTSMMDTYIGVIDDKKPLCFTEIGYLSPEGLGSPLPDMFGWAANVTVEQQAEWLAQAAAMAEQSGKVRLMIVWNIDFTKNSGNYPQGGYAIIRPDGDCPACEALSSLR